MGRSTLYDASKDISSLAGKVIFITGGTAGLGRETILSFAAHEPGHIYFSGRSQSSADKLITEVITRHPDVKVSFVKIDQADLASVKSAAKEFRAKESRLDVLMANAGIMAVPAGLTKDGYEIQFGTNHVGHALLAELLTPLMEATAQKTGDARVIWTTSLGYKVAPKGGILFSKLKTEQRDISPLMGEWLRYGQSKLANLLYAREYAKHHPTITSVSIHPGVSATSLVRSLGWFNIAFIYATSWTKMISPEECAWNQQWAATAPVGKGEKEVISGEYYEPVAVHVKPSGDGANDKLAEELWRWTEKQLEIWLQ